MMLLQIVQDHDFYFSCQSTSI